MPLRMLVNAIEYQCETDNETIARDERYKKLFEKSLRAERALRESINDTPNGPALFAEYDTSNAELQDYVISAVYFAGFVAAMRMIGEEEMAVYLDYLAYSRRSKEQKEGPS